MVVPDSQADQAGIQRGDILCFAGSHGQDEIMYDLFLDMAKSPQRPLRFDLRRIQASTSTTGTSTTTGSTNTSTTNRGHGTLLLGSNMSSSTSADAYNRKQAMIAAAEAREKANKAKLKPVGKPSSANPNAALRNYTSEEQRKMEQERLAQMLAQQESEATRQAKERAKREEAALAAQLGYNPYEIQKSTAGQARTATTTTKVGAITANHAGDHLPSVAPPTDPTSQTDLFDSVEDPHFLEAYHTLISSSQDITAIKSSITIVRKLILNATTKGQEQSDHDNDDTASKFRRVRLSNPKIQSSIVNVPGAVEVLLACGFHLTEEDQESYLIYPMGYTGPDWLPAALQQLEQAAVQLQSS